MMPTGLSRKKARVAIRSTTVYISGPPNASLLSPERDTASATLYSSAFSDGFAMADGDGDDVSSPLFFFMDADRSTPTWIAGTAAASSLVV